MLGDRVKFLTALAMTVVAACAPALDQRADAPASIFEGRTTNTYHGTTVLDPYRALEDWNNPSVQAWSDGQTEQANRCLTSLPYHAEIKSDLMAPPADSKTANLSSLSMTNGTIFALRSVAELQQPQLVSGASLADLATVKPVFDLNMFDPSGDTSIIWFKPSPDASKVAIALSKGGSERGTLHVIDRQMGEMLETRIPNVYNPTAGGDLSWFVDSSGFYYSRYPVPGDAHEDDPSAWIKLYAHKIGENWTADPELLGDRLNKTSQIRLVREPQSGDLIAWLQDGDSGLFSHLRLTGASDWAEITDYVDGHFQLIPADDGSAFLLSNADAPKGRVLKIPVGGTLTDAVEVIPEQADASLSHSYYSHASPTGVWHGGRLYLKYNIGGPSELRVFDGNGQRIDITGQPAAARLTQLTPLANAVLFESESYTQPNRWLQIDADSTMVDVSALLQSELAGNWSDIATTRMMATSKDGTQVPVTLLHPTDLTVDTPRTLLVYGYGGFRYNLEPQFKSEYRTLLDRGMLVAEVNLRGGAEFGENWHAGGALLNKQNVFDDFAAAIMHLQTAGYTSPRQTAIMGVSNGGLLVGAMLTQYPDLFSTAIAKVGLYDMLRAELDPNGVYNIPEFGSVTDPEQFRALLAYSPYHQLRDDTPYPAVLFTTGANDQRVNPMHSRKMTAHMQNATSSNRPILLLANRTGGHGRGISADAHAVDVADTFAFVLALTNDVPITDACKRP